MKILLNTAFLLASYQLALACTCIGEATVKEEMARSSAVFMGTVVSSKLKTVADDSQAENLRLDLEYMEFSLVVEHKYKGWSLNDTVQVVTGFGGGDCGFEFALGKAYFVYCSYEDRHWNYGEKVKKFLTTDICRRTRLATDTSERQSLEKYSTLPWRLWRWWKGVF